MSERCAGCGIEAAGEHGEHQWAGLGMAAEGLVGAEIQGVDSVKGFKAYAVCDACFMDTAHRRRVLKMSFFAHRDIRTAMAAVSSNTIQM